MISSTEEKNSEKLSGVCTLRYPIMVGSKIEHK